MTIIGRVMRRRRSTRHLSQRTTRRAGEVSNLARRPLPSGPDTVDHPERLGAQGGCKLDAKPTSQRRSHIDFGTKEQRCRPALPEFV